MSKRPDFDLSLALCIHTNAFALLIPANAHLLLLIWLDPVDIVTRLESGILAIFTAAVCCILSNKYGVTQPLHEAAAFVLTVHIVFGMSQRWRRRQSFTSSVGFLPSEEFWGAQWSIPLYVIFSIPITRGIWKAAMYWANWGHREGGGNPLPVWAIPGDSGAFSVDKSDGLHEKLVLGETTL
ncbi:hypothetical protein DFH06DRAFT_45725 [Mycena polygramma]|nr:hypothetical protein DFH06DRAFT_45725 [Mycena polygramma]